MSDDGRALRELVDPIRIAMVTTIAPDGLRGRPMTVQHVDDEGTVWFLLDAEADWVTGDDLGDTNVAWSSDDRWISATGHATVVRDRDRLHQLTDALSDTWFQDGTDKTALRVEVAAADHWTAPGTITRLLKIAVAKARDDRPDLGDRGTVEP